MSRRVGHSGVSGSKRSIGTLDAGARRAAVTDSERMILGVVLRGGGLTQPEVSRSTGLAQQSVSRLVKGLIERGALYEGARVLEGRRGQPSMSVEIAPNFLYSFGVAMMTDALSVVLMDFSGIVLEQAFFPMPVMSRSRVFEKLEATFESFLRKRNLDRERVFGVGVGVSGYCLGGRGRYNTPRSLDEWALVDIGAILSDRLNYPVWVENDGNVAAIGESLVGAGRASSDFVYLYIAAGIGGGVVINNSLLRGRHGNGGEIGLMLPRGTYAQPDLSLLRNLVAKGGVETDGISDMLSRFDINWAGNDEWIERTRDSFSLIISALAATLDPDAIVIGGRIPKALAERLIPNIEIFDDARRAEPRTMPRVILSETAGDACAIGAAALPLHSHYFTVGQGLVTNPISGQWT